jgi:hypothetical protein
MIRLLTITNRVALNIDEIVDVSWSASSAARLQDSARVAMRDGTIHYFARFRLTPNGAEYLDGWARARSDRQ